MQNKLLIMEGWLRIWKISKYHTMKIGIVKAATQHKISAYRKTCYRDLIFFLRIVEKLLRAEGC